MALSLDTVQLPKPSEIVISFNGEDLHLSYDRNAFTNAMTEALYQTPLRARLGLLLLSWDLEKDGQPWQPEPLSDPVWTRRAEARRLAAALMEKRGDSAPDSEKMAGLAAPELTDEERADVLRLPISAAERRAAYAAAWDAIFVLLPREFLKAVDAGVLDDFLGMGWRK